jgi:hypothetical protein
MTLIGGPSRGSDVDASLNLLYLVQSTPEKKKTDILLEPSNNKAHEK